MPIFWMLYDQQGAAWVLQSQRMRLPPYMEAEQLGVLNTIFVLVLLPTFENGLYPWLKTKGLEPTQLTRMTVGMFLGAVAFIMSGLLEVAIIKSKKEDGTSDISAFWQTPQYFVLTVAELGVSTTGLEFFYVEAPPAMRTAASALFLLTTAVGDLLGGVLYDVCGQYKVPDDKVLLFCGALLGGVSAVFAGCARKYKYRSQGEDKKKRSSDDDEEDEDDTLIDDERIRLNGS
jgi:dipeptide/tripeptide permease